VKKNNKIMMTYYVKCNPSVIISCAVTFAMMQIYNTCIKYDTYLIRRYVNFENSRTRHVIYAY